jgi:hypothetical protein
LRRLSNDSSDQEPSSARHHTNSNARPVSINEPNNDVEIGDTQESTDYSIHYSVNNENAEATGIDPAGAESSQQGASDANSTRTSTTSP